MLLKQQAKRQNNIILGNGCFIPAPNLKYQHIVNGDRRKKKRK